MAAGMLPWLVMGSGGYLLYKKDVPEFIKNWSEFKGNKNENDSSRHQQGRDGHSSHVERAPVAPQIVVLPDQSNTNHNRPWFFWSVCTVGALGVYYYYIHKNGTTQIVTTVEDTAEETQDVVKECDDNNEKRFEELDKRNEERTDELSGEIRGEQRAHFEVLSKQLYCVTQVCLQTLNAVANGITGQTDEFQQPDEKLIAYSEKAQSMSDKLFENETYLRARELHLRECRAELGSRRRTKTPGGGDTEEQMKESGNHRRMRTGKSLDDYGTTPGGPSDEIDGFHFTETDDGTGGTAGNGSSPFIKHVSAPETPGRSGSKKRRRRGKSSKKNKVNKKPVSVMDYEWVQNLEMSAWQSHLATQYVDPVYNFGLDHKFGISFGLAATTMGWKAINAIMDSRTPKIPPNQERRGTQQR